METERAAARPAGDGRETRSDAGAERADQSGAGAAREIPTDAGESGGVDAGREAVDREAREQTARQAREWVHRAAQPPWIPALGEAIDSARAGDSVEEFGAVRWRRLVGDAPNVAVWGRDGASTPIRSWNDLQRFASEQPDYLCVPDLDRCRGSCCDVQGAGPIGPPCAHHGKPVFAACFRGAAGARTLSEVFVDCPVDRDIEVADVAPSCLDVARTGPAGAGAWDCSNRGGGVGVWVRNGCETAFRIPKAERTVDAGDEIKIHGTCRAVDCELTWEVEEPSDAGDGRRGTIRVDARFRIPARDGFESLDRRSLLEAFGFEVGEGRAGSAGHVGD